MNRIFVICFSLLIASIARCGDVDVYASRCQQLADISHEQIKTPEGHAYEQELVKAHNKFWRDVHDKCVEAAREEDIASFHSIIVINSAGEVTEFLPLPQSANFQCFVTNMVGKKYPAPPHAPFYEVLNVHLSKGAH